MSAGAFWLGVCGLLFGVGANVVSNILSLLDVKEAIAKGVTPEDVIGFGIAPIWVTVGILLGLLLLQGRKYLRQPQIALLFLGFLSLLIADWVTYLKLLASMGL